MYESELHDLEGVYRKALEEIKEQEEMVMPELLDLMEELIELNRNKRTIADKLDLLICKKEMERNGES